VAVSLDKPDYDINDLVKGSFKITPSDKSARRVCVDEDTPIPVGGNNPNGTLNTQVVSGLSDTLSFTGAVGAGATQIIGPLDNSKWVGVAIFGYAEAAATAPGTMFLEFSTNGTDWDQRNTQIDLTDAANVFLPRTLLRISKFFRIRYVNGAQALTELTIQTFLSNCKAELTSRLDQTIDGNEDVQNVRSVLVGQKPNGVFQNVGLTVAGNQAMSVVDSETGVPSIVTETGSLKVAEHAHFVGESFGGHVLSTNIWDIVVVGSGVQNGLVPGAVEMNTGVTANSGVSIQTCNISRFHPDTFNNFHAGMRFTDGDTGGTANNVKRWGAFSPQDGVDSNGLFFEVDGTDWYTVSRKNNVDTRVAEVDWNGENPIVKDNLTHSYAIRYNAGIVYFYQGFNLLHTQSLASTEYADTYHLKCAAEIFNKNGSTTDVNIFFRTLGINTIGKLFGAVGTTPVEEGVTVVKSGPGYLQGINWSRDGSGAGVGILDVYDNTAASGKAIRRLRIPGNDTGYATIGIHFSNGLTIDMSGAGVLTAEVDFN